MWELYFLLSLSVNLKLLKKKKYSLIVKKTKNKKESLPALVPRPHFSFVLTDTGWLATTKVKVLPSTCHPSSLFKGQKRRKPT